MKTLTASNTYHFRTTPRSAANADQAAHPDKFDKVDATVKGVIVPSWKRKSEEATYNAPLLDKDEAPSEEERGLVNELLAQLVQDFVKTQYIDKFIPVGAHDLATIIAHRAEMAARKPSASTAPEAEALLLGEQAFTNYLMVAVPKFAPRIEASKLFTSKVTDTAIVKCLGVVEANRFDNFLNHASTCLELVPSLELGEAEAPTAAALTYLIDRLNSFKSKTFAAIDEDDGM